MIQDKVLIPTSSILEGLKLPFSVFLFINNHFILYKKDGDSLTREEIEKFNTSDKVNFYIDKSDLSKYQSYLINECALPKEEREKIEEELIKGSSKIIIEDLFNNSDTEKAIESARFIVDTFIERLKHNVGSLTNLMQLLQHDYYTFNHSIDVCAYTIIFTNELLKIGYIKKKTSVQEYAFGGLLHDIGKKEIPSELINKPTRLNPEEWEIMKTHTTRGAKILRRTKFANLNILEAAEMHHEQIDGFGYPYGKKGKEIPLIAKIVSICDVFDALTTSRPYSSIFTPQKALHTMKFELSNKFDSELFRVFEKRVYEVLVPSVEAYQSRLS